jgi:arginyl-tRNA synthetase
MSSLEGGLATILGRLGLESPVSEYTGADIRAKPVDIFWCHHTSLLAPVLETNGLAIYDAINSTNDASLGNLAVILPKLKLSEEKLKNLTLDLKGKVRCTQPIHSFLFISRRLPANLHSELPASPLYQAPSVSDIHLRLLFFPKALPRLLLSYISSRKST